jgi:hypothetical protein
MGRRRRPRVSDPFRRRHTSASTYDHERRSRRDQRVSVAPTEENLHYAWDDAVVTVLEKQLGTSEPEAMGSQVRHCTSGNRSTAGWRYRKHAASNRSRTKPAVKEVTGGVDARQRDAQGPTRKKRLKPAAQRMAVRKVMERHGLSQRHACRLVAIVRHYVTTTTTCDRTAVSAP